MARAIWKAVVRFDDVALPVKLYSGVEDRAIHFHLLHDQDMVRVRQRMVNPETGKEVPRAETQRGAPLGDGRFAVLRDEELEALDPPPSRDIEIERFVDPHQISDQWYDRPYYLGPDDGAADDYWTFTKALEKQDKEGVARWVMRKREYVGSLRVVRGRLMLITLRFEDQVIPASQLAPPKGRDLSKKELQMAEQLVAALEEPFDSEAYHDEYRRRVMELIETKAKGGKVKLTKPKEKAPPRKSISDMLEASLKAAKSSKKPPTKKKRPKEKAHA